MDVVLVDSHLAGVAVDVRHRHFLSFDERLVFAPMKAHHRDNIDRRGLRMRGYSSWLMARIVEGLESGRVPDNPGLRLDIRKECRWPTGVHLDLTRRWYTEFRHLGGGHQRGHSLIVNLWAFEALQAAEEARGGQLQLAGVSGSLRRGRVAHTPLGAPDRAYLV